MTKIVTCLWFDHGQAQIAAEFYATIFADTYISKTHSASDVTVEFTLLGQAFIGLNGGPAFAPNEAVSFQVLTDDQAETDRYWDAIVGNGGSEGRCGWCKDRWGFSWQITPRALLAALNNPDQAAAKRATDAMMPMRRIDIARIQAASA